MQEKWLIKSWIKTNGIKKRKFFIRVKTKQRVAFLIYAEEVLWEKCIKKFCNNTKNELHLYIYILEI
jgi:hypothetical protein